MDKVVHFEIPVDDTARAREFYGSCFDWELNEADMGGGNMYTTVTTTDIDQATRLPTEPGAINGGLMQRTADTPTSVITIGVTSIDESLKKVEAGGGSTVQPRTEIRRWARSPTSRTARATWSGCGRTSDLLTQTDRAEWVVYSSHAPSRIRTRPSSSFDSRHAWISLGAIRR